MPTFTLRTSRREEFLDLTPRLAALVAEAGGAGICHVFIPHTTAGVTINENADPSVVRDMLAALRRLVPADGDYTHAEGNSDAHLKASLMGFSATVPFQDGRLALGTWQAIYFCEFDGPRSREVRVQLISAR
jgi:secondary thiamine-phosphate synthase enzyme